VNCYPEKADGQAADGFYLDRSPGLTEFADTEGGRCRGMIAIEGEVLSVHSQALYRINSDGTTDYIGIIPGDDNVVLAANDAAVAGTKLQEVAIVGDLGTYIYQNGAISPLDTLDFGLPNSAEYIDGYIIYTFADGTFAWSAISEAGSIDALDFASAEGDPDGLLRCLKVRRELYMMGPKTIEVWTHTEDASAPFQRLPGAVLPVGLLATKAACTVAGDLYWVDANRIVRKLGGGYAAEIIGNDGLYRAIADVADTSKILMFGYVMGLHKFVVLTAPEMTWVYDDLNGVWHEKQSYNYDNWQAIGYCYGHEKHLVGSDISGKVLFIDENAANEDGEPLVLKARLPTVVTFPGFGVMHSLDVNIETGVGVLDGASQDEDPELMLRWSLDGANTWSSERKRKLGALANRRRCVRFTGLGPMSEKGVVFELSVSAAVKCRIVSAFLNASPRKS
jgi:hypothetical protein